MGKREREKDVKIVLVNIIKDINCEPINLLYLATYIKKNFAKVKVRIVDINFEEPLKKILQLNPDIIGISSMTITYNYACRLAEQIKGVLDVPLIIGGVHISSCPESLSKYFDIGVVGEGEKTFFELIKLFKNERKLAVSKLKKIGGLVFWENGKIARTKDSVFIKKLDDIPIPDRKLLDKRYFLPRVSYDKIRGEKVIEAGIMTSRGCPYKCVFCSASAFWKTIRFCTADYVVKEIKYLADNFGVNYVFIHDDLFTADVNRVEKIYEKLNENGIIGKVKFTCQLRANIVNEELCKLLKKFGVVTVSFGFESGSDRVLKYLKADSVTVEQNKNAVKLCRKYGLDVTGSFMIASPEEKIEDMEKTLQLIKYLKSLGASELWCGVTKPFPNTRLWDFAVKNDLISKNFDWSSVDYAYVHNPIFLDKSVSKKEFLKIFREIKDKSFTTSMKGQPNKILRTVKDFFSYNEFLYKFARKTIEILPRKARNLLEV
jgi:radical SAM superfamily enzyme YgiQ (UPF0313 family)